MGVHRSALMALVVSLAAIAPAELGAQPKAKPTLDYDFYKSRVEPIFLKKKAGYTRCIVCHSESNNFFKLEAMSPGAKTWTDEQSRKNFETVSKLVNPGEPMVSRLLMHPLAPRGRRRLSFRRPAVHVGQRSRLEGDGGLRQRSDARRPFKEELMFVDRSLERHPFVPGEGWEPRFLRHTGSPRPRGRTECESAWINRGLAFATIRNDQRADPLWHLADADDSLDLHGRGRSR